MSGRGVVDWVCGIPMAEDRGVAGVTEDGVWVGSVHVEGKGRRGTGSDALWEGVVRFCVAADTEIGFHGRKWSLCGR